MPKTTPATKAVKSDDSDKSVKSVKIPKLHPAFEPTAPADKVIVVRVDDVRINPALNIVPMMGAVAAHLLSSTAGPARQAGAVTLNWPTNEMIEAGRKAAISHGPLLGGGQSLWHVFRDMLAAAPSPQKQGGQHD